MNKKIMYFSSSSVDWERFKSVYLIMCYLCIFNMFYCLETNTSEVLKLIANV